MVDIAAVLSAAISRGWQNYLHFPHRFFCEALTDVSKKQPRKILGKCRD